MPKARVERELSNDGKVALIERDVTQRSETKQTQYYKPVTFAAMMEMLQGASEKPGLSYKKLFPLTDKVDDTEETEQAFFLSLFQNGLDKWAAADVYESIAGESTVITIGKEKLDLMTVPLDDLIDGYNGTMKQVAVRTKLKGGTPEAREAAEKSVGSIPAWNSVAKKLTQGYTDDDDRVVPAQAKLEDGQLVRL